jgi:hypothetical protein
MKCIYESDPSGRQRAGNAARGRMEEMFSEERVVKAYLDCLSA